MPLYYTRCELETSCKAERDRDRKLFFGAPATFTEPGCKSSNATENPVCLRLISSTVPDTTEPIRNTAAYKTLSETLVDALDDSGSAKHAGFEEKEARRRRRQRRLEKAGKNAGIAPKRVVADPDAGSSVVLHKDSARQEKWNQFKETNPVLRTLVLLRQSYDESENPVVSSVRSVTETIGSWFEEKWFEENETAQVMRLMSPLDPEHVVPNAIPMGYSSETAIPLEQFRLMFFCVEGALVQTVAFTFRRLTEPVSNVLPSLSSISEWTLAEALVISLSSALRALGLSDQFPQDYDVVNPPPHTQQKYEYMYGDLSDLEEDTARVRLTKTQKRNAQKREKKRKDAAEAREARAEEIKIHITATLQLLYGPQMPIHVHLLYGQMHLLERLHDEEEKTGTPLRQSVLNDLGFKMIYEPGVHLGLYDAENEEQKIIFIVKITPWNTMSTAQKERIQQNLQTIMSSTQYLLPITNNASMRAPRASTSEHSADHGVRGSRVALPGSKRGKMYGLGWHAAQETGKTLAYYAFKGSGNSSISHIETLLSELPAVASLYRERLSLLFPGGHFEMESTAETRGIYSFDYYLDGVDKNRPFANSLTVTNSNFSNFFHRDRDLIAAAFGLWWTALERKEKGQNRHYFSDDVDHSAVKDGAFGWGAYGIAVDFNRATGLVEIFWRGKIDFHATVQSESPPLTHRWGTSVQLTTRGVNAMECVWNTNALDRIVTPTDRIENLNKRMKTKR